MAERSKASGVLAAAYVQVFVNRDYGGASAYLSANYPNLGTIGWNDRISSYKVLISGSGEFREHANYVGAIDEFCCTQWVTYVGDYYNDKFSSVRTP
ncbi:MAG: beta/gamma crystallin family protein [Chloroflexi bacterium]|nr:beta/gamma crystallin family protein [Chloroflexota bacterium]